MSDAASRVLELFTRTEKEGVSRVSRVAGVVTPAKSQTNAIGRTATPKNAGSQSEGVAGVANSIFETPETPENKLASAEGVAAKTTAAIEFSGSQSLPETPETPETPKKQVGVICIQCGGGPGTDPAYDAPTIEVGDRARVHRGWCHRFWLRGHPQSQISKQEK